MYQSDINDKELQVSIKLSNWILTDSQFYDEIKEIKSFSHTDLSGVDVAQVIYENRHNLMIVKGYKTFYPYRWPFPKVKGYFSHSEPNVINVNLRALHTMDTFDHVANNIHEFTHSLGFTHDGNKKHENDNLRSVPYVVGYLAGSFAKRKWLSDAI